MVGGRRMRAACAALPPLIEILEFAEFSDAGSIPAASIPARCGPERPPSAEGRSLVELRLSAVFFVEN